MGMKPPMHEAQGKLCPSLSIPGPQDNGEFPPEQNLVSSMKPAEESVHTMPGNLVAIACGGTTKNPG